MIAACPLLWHPFYARVSPLMFLYEQAPMHLLDKVDLTSSA
jgi:hypothetical protein